MTRHRAGSAGSTRNSQLVAFAGGPFGVDLRGVADLAADDVLQPLVAVEPAAVRADLCHPRPHVHGGRFDADAVRPAPPRLRNQFVARVTERGGLRAGTPAAAPAPAERGQQHSRHDGYADGAFRDVTPPVASRHHRNLAGQARGAGA